MKPTDNDANETVGQIVMFNYGIVMMEWIERN